MKTGVALVAVRIRPPGSRRQARADRGDVGGVGRRPAFEHRRAGDQHVGAGVDDQRRRFRRDPAVDLDADRPSPIIALTRATFSTIAGRKPGRRSRD